MLSSLAPAHPALDFTLRALAAYRLTRLVTEDRLSAPLRAALFRRFPLEEHPYGPAYLITCPYCFSVYASAFTFAFAPAIPDLLVRTLAAAALTCVYQDIRDAML